MPIKIALNAHLLSAQAGYRSAGIHGYIYHLLQHLPLQEPTWDYHVLVGEGQPPAHPQVQVERSHFSTGQPLRRIVWEQVLQPRVLKQLRPDLYHALAFVSPLRLSIPSLVTVHDLSFIRYPTALSRSRRLYLQWLTRHSCHQAQRIIAVSASTARDVVELLEIPPEKVTVVVSGVDERFKPLPAEEVAHFRHQKGLPERFLLHLGTLEPRKNLALLLRAYAALPTAERQAVPLVLAGGLGWAYQDIFDTLDRYKLRSMVHLVGYVESEALPLWYNAALALVYPSLYEGWGLPVVEAMACGRPTLVSDSSSLPEAAGETGWRVAPQDESGWTQALQEIIHDVARRERSGQAGLARAQQFTWQQTARATLAAYHQVLTP